MEEAANDLIPAPERSAPMSSQHRQARQGAALFVGFVILYLASDRLSFIDALHGIGITAWSPSTGLILALLIIKGLRWSAVVLVAELVSGLTLPAVPIPPAPVVVAALVVTGGYASAVAFLRTVGFEASLRRTCDVVLLLAVTIISSGLVACGFVAAYSAAEIVPWTGFASAVLQYWIGDAIGIIVLVPPLLILNRSITHPAPTNRGWGWLQMAEIAGQGSSIVVALAAVFLRVGGDHPFGVFYLLFLPMTWIATRRGLAGASCAVLAIQAGLLTGLELQDQWETSLRAFQLLMFALATTGLMLGAVVSERGRLMHALAESESRRMAILNTARDGILTIDGAGQIQSINRAVEQLFGRPGSFVIGHDVREFVDGTPDLVTRLRRINCSLAAEATCWELDARRAEGGVFPIELTVGRFDPPGAEHYTLVVRDITLRRNAEARAREHQAEQAHVSRVSLVGEMTAGLAHELSQPLTAIAAFGRGCLRLLSAATPDLAMLHEGVLEVVQQAERAGDVLSRLREFVRGEACRHALVEVTTIIDAAASLARVEATQNEVEISARIDPDLPSVLADHIQIEQVLLNLLRNAMDTIVTANTDRRSIVIEARRKSRSAIEITVADSGPGVAEELTGKLFDPFVTTKPLGMGLGLSISRSIVESHGGRLRMARNATSGAIFAFDLPTDGPEARGHAG